MKKERSIIRAFVAVEIGDDVREALMRVERELKKAEGRVSWIRPENIHLTLVFFGDVSPQMAPQIGERLDTITKKVAPFSMNVANLGTFGRKNHPQVLWAGLPDPPQELLNLRADVALVAEDVGIPVEKRPFKPHLTLGRVRGSRNLTALTSAISSANNTRHGSVDVRRILLMQSRLEPDGAKYSILHESLLKGE